MTISYGRARRRVALGSDGFGLRRRDDREMRSSNWDSDRTPKPIGVIIPVRGLGEEGGRHLRHPQRRRDAVVRAAHAGSRAAGRRRR
jgi:hypothetical protein